MLAVAGFAAGVVNAIAGGGSLVSFPALLATGMPAVTANATNTLAVWPGAVSSAWAYRETLRQEQRLARFLAVPSALGGLAGGVLLWGTDERWFDALVPWLVLFACGLLAVQPRLQRVVAERTPAHGAPAAMWVAQLAISVYGGYFGAGMGIVMLAAMGALLPTDLQRANALKLSCALVINGVAACWFLGIGAASLPHAAFMAVASLAGGYAGARLAQVLSPELMRALVVGYGLIAAAALAAR